MWRRALGALCIAILCGCGATVEEKPAVRSVDVTKEFNDGRHHFSILFNGVQYASLAISPEGKVVETGLYEASGKRSITVHATNTLPEVRTHLGKGDAAFSRFVVVDSGMDGIPDRLLDVGATKWYEVRKVVWVDSEGRELPESILGGLMVKIRGSIRKDK